MGSGASKAPAASNAVKATVKEKPVKAKSPRKPKTTSQDEADFNATCRAVFDESDLNKNGLLDDGEFWLVLETDKLALNLSKAEINEIRRLAEVDGPLPPISYEQFVPMFKSLLQKVYEQNSNDWNDWCVMKEPKTGVVLYLNKRTGDVTKQKPPNFNPERVEEQLFEYIVLDDGTELTTTVSDTGQRMYMDWDEQSWQVLPEEWLGGNTKVRTDFQRGQTVMDIDASTGMASANADTTEASMEEVDPRVGEYTHPSRGLMHTYMFENTRNTRIYYDDKVNNWARMPLAWERNVTEVRAMLDEINALLPRWKNVNEQMLTLRECNYDLQDAIIFAEINWGYRPGDASAPSKLQRQLTRTGQLLGPDTEEDLGVLSKAAAAKIYNLEQKLSAATERVAELEAAKQADEANTVRKLKRENTKLDQTLNRSERKAIESTQQAQELSSKVQELTARLSEAERELLAARANAEHTEALEAQLTALKGGDSKAEQALQERSKELERMRTENTHLKMKVQQLKEQLENPLSSKAAQKVLKSLASKVTQLKEAKVQLATDITAQHGALGQIVEDAVTKSKSLEGTVAGKLESITSKYRAEVLQRKLLYNKLQELRGNIRVFLRVRQDKRDKCVFQFPSETEAMVPSLRGESTMFDFDRVFKPDSKQEDIFEDTKPVIMSCVDGYNVCLMAYGQTGSGKTYTMMGTKSDPGINRRAIRELLHLCKQSTLLKTSFVVSLVEVYNENVYDLLAKVREPRRLKQGVDGVFAEGLQERPIESEADVLKVLEDGDANRSIAATKMNTDSSRSHLILTINVSTLNTVSNVYSRGRLTLVDLAGSERVARSAASGERLVEAAAINKSLSALGQVFSAIAGNAPHVPYRNSKLTHLLQDSLGGDSKTCMFINTSPLEINLSETHSTLNFGKGVRKIELGQASKHTKTLPPPPGGV